MNIALSTQIYKVNNEHSIDRAMPFLRRKQTGSYYTSSVLTAAMMDELVQSLPLEKRSRLYELKLLEPCVGEGSFVFAYLTATLNFNFSREQYRHLLHNIEPISVFKILGFRCDKFIV